MSTATDEVGTQLTRIVRAGLTRRHAFATLGLTVGVGRRLLLERQPPRERRTPPSSTDPTDTVVDSKPASEPDLTATPGGTTNGVD
jgi:hypothetical protein